MNIEELIREKCPNGIEYKKIGDFADTNIGLATSVTQHKSKEGILLLHNSDIKQNKIELKSIEYIDESFANKNSSKFHQLHDIITVHTGDVGTSAVIEEEYVGTMGFTTITTRIRDKNYISPYYLSHYLNSNTCKKQIAKFTISDRSNLNQKSFVELIIPIPPMEIQKEIVSMLDKFTELEAELEAELEDRESQYDYYKNKILEPKEDWNSISMEELCEMITKQTGFDYSATIKPALVSEKEENTLSFIQNKDFSGQFFNYDTDYYIPESVADKFPKITLDKPSILFSISGKIGNVGLFENKKKAFIGGAICICKLKENNPVLNKYILYYSQSKYGQKYLFKSIKAASHLNVTVESIRNMKIFYPSIAEQEKIIKTLEQLDNLCNSITEGLPAEIKLRQQQYEYYRDKLLTFN